MSKYLLKQINVQQLKRIYKEHIKADFPPIERPPYFTMKKNMEKGVQEAFVLEDEGEEVGYCTVVLGDDAVLISLLAVYPQVRDRGYGSAFLGELVEHYGEDKLYIVEVEKPELLEKQEERILAEQRISFYERNGYVLHWDVDYKIFRLPMYLMTYSGNVVDDEVVKTAIVGCYHRTLSKRFYKMVEVN